MSIFYSQWKFNDIRKRFRSDLPDIYLAAEKSLSVDEFKITIKNICPDKTISRLIEFDGQTITDFSTGKEVAIRTISLLYSFLRNTNPGCKSKYVYSNEMPLCKDIDNEATIDLLTDLFFILQKAYGKELLKPSSGTIVSQWTKQWSSGSDPAVQQAREENKQRIIGKLVSRIERKCSLKYVFPESFSFEEKHQQVEEWWNNYRFHLAMAIKSPDDLNAFLDNTLSDETMQILRNAKKKGIPFFVTPYYLSLLDITGNTYDDIAIRSYILYTRELVDTFGQIKAWEKEDEVEPGKANTAGWILPDGRNIHRRYPEVAIFIPDSGGRACGGLCASCQRMYDFQSKRLNFNLKELLPKDTWPTKLKKLMTYFEEDTQLRDILITGGDALMSRNTTLKNIFDAIYKMALQKKKANENRPDGEKFAEIQRIRLGTRLPAYLPMRVDDELISILKEFREKASKIGIKQFFVQTHFQTPLEMTKEACEAIKRITSAGWIITNQLVYNVAASRRGHTVALRKTLINNGIIPYYTFSVKGFHENYAVYAPIARSMQEQEEEKADGVLSKIEQEQFVEILQNNIPYTKELNSFLLKNKRKFVSTDRSILNLPGIGKSMTFNLIGITNEGKRILCFEHDTTRKHSPAIETYGKIYITENKSILAYLKQLELLGEDIKLYHSIWKYTEGAMEPKFKLYEYPEFPFTTTKEINHMEE